MLLCKNYTLVFVCLLYSYLNTNKTLEREEWWLVGISLQQNLYAARNQFDPRDEI